MKFSFNIKVLENLIADFVNNITYKRISNKLKKEDLMAEVDDQRAHHFYSS